MNAPHKTFGSEGLLRHLSGLFGKACQANRQEKQYLLFWKRALPAGGGQEQRDKNWFANKGCFAVQKASIAETQQRILLPQRSLAKDLI